MDDTRHSSAAPRLCLTATYRVQLNHRFTLRDAHAIVPYLDRLGISHLYCSPILAARPKSMHGYDVTDPTRVNPEIGTVDDLRALAEALRARGMGMIVDIVPNHMGIGRHNPYWEDVLTHGAQSRYAKWFDIDWTGGDDAPPPHRRVVLPVLRDELDAVLGRHELTVDVRERTPRLCYFDNSWPLDPATMPDELELAKLDTTAVADPNVFFRGEEGSERFRALLDAQHYRLTSWRRGPSEINYRRFFDVNDLAALRQEDPEVFAETHAFILSLVEEGTIDGLRVDHVDGLLDPLGYLTRLRAEVQKRFEVLGLRFEGKGATSHLEPQTSNLVPIFVEKILSPGEQLRSSWPVQGTTGYEFLNDLEDVFLDPSGYAEIERGYRRSRRLTSGDFADVAYQGKVKILTGALRADVTRLARLLSALLDDSVRRPDSGVQGPPLHELERGIVEFIAVLPVYRTYVDGRGPVHPDDVAVVERAVATARRRLGDTPPIRIVQLVADVVLGRDNPEHVLPPMPARLPFIQRLQQTSGPATAKGVEDTALYVYMPLASRNEVGGAPDRPLDDAVGRFHRANATRAHCWPSALTTTNTHDTKRSADLRARLDTLTECAPLWHRHVARWRRLNHRHRTTVRGRLAPDGNSEHLLYQTLIGLWPAPRPGRRADDIPNPDWLASARERLERYMLKAAKEAKVRTNWTDPDAAYEDALKRFIAAILEPSDDAPFLADVARFVARIAAIGHWNALARLLLHLTAPGTPDTYRGDELWFFALVDPDNRQPVDYRERERLLEEVTRMHWDERGPPSLGARGSDSGLKLGMLRRVLNSRRENPALFGEGVYRPLELRGAHASHLIAFARSHDDAHAIVVAPRLLASVVSSETRLLDWQDTTVVLPPELAGRELRSVLTDDASFVAGAPPTLGATSLLARHPFALVLTM